MHATRWRVVAFARGGTAIVAVTVALALAGCTGARQPAYARQARTLPATLEGSELLECSLAGVPHDILAVSEAKPTEWHGRFDLPDSPALWQPIGSDATIEQFRDSVRARLGIEPASRSLIERQQKLYAATPGEWRGEAANARMVLDGRAGTIARISCLEAMLWKWQASRYPMLTHPTEFGALILRSEGRVRIYLSSDDLVGQRFRGTIAELVRKDTASGFRLIAHLHNHPFLFNRVVGDRMWTMEGTVGDVAGALAPSMTDVQFYRNLRASLGLAEGWVTNGMESAHFVARDFELLAGR